MDIIQDYVLCIYASTVLAVAAFYLFNRFSSPYLFDTAKLKKALDELAESKRCETYLPAAYRYAFKTYQRSVGQLPSQTMRFIPRRTQYKLSLVPLIFLLTCLTDCAVSAYLRQNYVPKVLSVSALLFVFAASLYFISLSHNRAKDKAEAQFSKFIIFCDLTCGVSNGQVTESIDELTEKIEFLRKSGINQASAEKIGALISQEQLEAPRTADEQRRLNCALNGLLTVISLQKERR